MSTFLIKLVVVVAIVGSVLAWEEVALEQEACDASSTGKWDTDLDECVCKRKYVWAAAVLQFFFGVVGGGWWYGGWIGSAWIALGMIIGIVVFGCIGACLMMADKGMSGMCLAGLSTLAGVGVEVYSIVGFIQMLINERPTPDGCFMQ